MSKFISPFTDFGFKRLFGEEAHKDLLIDFLNELLTVELQVHKGPITDVQYLPSEKLAASHFERGAIFDIYCELEGGRR